MGVAVFATRCRNPFKRKKSGELRKKNGCRGINALKAVDWRSGPNSIDKWKEGAMLCDFIIEPGQTKHIDGSVRLHQHIQVFPIPVSQWKGVPQGVGIAALMNVVNVSK